MSSPLARIEALKTRLANIKEQTAQAAKIGTSAMLATGGGALGGLLDAKFPKLPNTNVDTAGVGGALGVIAAMTGFFDEHSEHVGSIAGGMLAYIAGRELRQHFA